MIYYLCCGFDLMFLNLLFVKKIKNYIKFNLIDEIIINSKTSHNSTNQPETSLTLDHVIFLKKLIQS